MRLHLFSETKKNKPGLPKMTATEPSSGANVWLASTGFSSTNRFFIAVGPNKKVKIEKTKIEKVILKL